MSATAHVPLGSITEIVMGQAPPGVDCNKDGRGTVFVKAGEFDERRPLVREWTTNPLKIARSGDVLVCVVGATAGKINEAIDCAIGRSVAAVRPDVAGLAPSYLYHFLATQVLQLRGRSQGLAQGVITREMLKEMAIPLPPLPEQRRLAEVLDRAEALRAKRRAALAQLDTLTQSIFLDLFGDPATNPKGVRVVRLAELATRITDGVHQKPNYAESGVPFISVKDITTGKLIFDDCKFINAEDHQRFTKRCKPQRLDILYTKVGATYGRPAIIETDADFSIYVSVCLIKPRQEMVDPYFLAAALGTSAVKNQADRRIKGIGVPDLHLDQIQSFLIPLPAMSQQREFARCVASVERLKAAHRVSLAGLDALFASLQHRAFRGEL